ncbi:MAG: methyl-accepting chemotaxis protein [Treponema sp.]|nr:methyl-accepting chemotaxis protein [Treponema sp.]
MNVKNLKLTTRMAISVAAFLLPLGIMLHSVISVSLVSIRKSSKELEGIEVIRPAISLMQSIPQYVRFYVDEADGDIDFTKRYISDLLDELDEKYYKHFGTEAAVVSIRSLSENWEHLSNTRIRNTVLWAYSEMMGDLSKLIVYVGDISGLVTDSEIESAYLVAAAVHELPQVQKRLVSIGNLLRTIEAGAFTQRRRVELQTNLELLVYADNARLQDRFNAVGTIEIEDAEGFESFDLLLKACSDRITYFSEAAEEIINKPEIDLNIVPVLFEISAHANNAAYRLQAASLDRLGILISSRILAYKQRFAGSLAAALVATVFAFTIIILTVNYIRKSTSAFGSIFKRLDENELSVQIEALSRDEMGVLMKALGDFLNKLNAAFVSFNNNANLVSTAAMELSTSAKEITTTANQQSSSVAEIVSTMESNKELSAQAAEKTMEVAQLASQTQELSRRGANLRDINEDMMRDILDQNAKIIEIIRNLADMLSRIDESTQLIDSIADHTKIIAFNAALEASSSGEAGSRFSIVAGEIRRFANNVVESVAEIKEKIMELQEASQSLITEANSGSQAINIGYNRMVEQKEVFENIVNVSQNVANRSQQISNLSKQQEMASAQVFKALKEISLGANQFVSTTAMTSAAVEKLNSISTELKETLSKYQTTDRSNV